MNDKSYSLGRFLLCFLFIAAANTTVTATDSAGFHEAGAFKVRAELDPKTPKVGKNQVTIWVQDKTGQPVGGAKLKVVAVMPAMGSMPAMYAPA